MKSKQSIFIVSIIGVILVVGLLGFIINKSSGPSKYEGLAKALKTEGAVFYGAFWCPHCQATKALFGDAKVDLPYVECSNPDARSQTQICIDNKIESYPSWKFKNGITINAKEADTAVCAASPTGAPVPGEVDMCAHVHSAYEKVWIFANNPDHKFSIKSPKDPIRTGDTLVFPSEAMAVGEIPLVFLAEQINYKLPQ